MPAALLFLLVYLLENYSKYFDDFTCWLSGERSLPFGLLVSICCSSDLHFTFSAEQDGKCIPVSILKTGLLMTILLTDI